MNISRITLLELFNKYEAAQSAYMKTNGKYVVVPPVSGAQALIINDARQQVQLYRNELIARLDEVTDLT